ncbi:MAG: alginate lyase family protein, partial [Planctomycetes bacterium]|nr:alginate lyase family protein [Planctomycetota bacterium]
VFGIASFTNIAIAAQRCGFDAWSYETPDGRSIRRAVDWMLPYLTGERAWAWPQIHPFNPAEMSGPLAACAQRFPDGRYARALAGLDLPGDHRSRLHFAMG